jgi:hypothetical protein
MLQKRDDDSKQPKLDGFAIKFTSGNDRAKKITHIITRTMALDYQFPYSLEENKGFRELLAVLEPRYDLPSPDVCCRSCRRRRSLLLYVRYHVISHALTMTLA